MESKKYTLEQEQIARFAKAMGHPARMAILEFLAKQDCCFFGDIHERTPHRESDGFTTSERVERSRFDTRRDRNAESEILYQSRELENSFDAFFLNSSDNVYAKRRVVANRDNFLGLLFVVLRITNTNNNQ